MAYTQTSREETARIDAAIQANTSWESFAAANPTVNRARWDRRVEHLQQPAAAQTGDQAGQQAGSQGHPDGAAILLPALANFDESKEEERPGSETAKETRLRNKVSKQKRSIGELEYARNIREGAMLPDDSLFADRAAVVEKERNDVQSADDGAGTPCAMQQKLGQISRGRYRLPDGFNPETIPFYLVSLATRDSGVAPIGGRVLLEGEEFAFHGNAIHVPYIERNGLPGDYCALTWLPAPAEASVAVEALAPAEVLLYHSFPAGPDAPAAAPEVPALPAETLASPEGQAVGAAAPPAPAPTAAVNTPQAAPKPPHSAPHRPAPPARAPTRRNRPCPCSQNCLKRWACLRRRRPASCRSFSAPRPKSRSKTPLPGNSRTSLRKTKFPA